MDETTNPVVSTVITTYYRNELLPDAIESVQTQTHPDIEIIVVDDSGEAHAAPIVEDWDGVKYVPLDENRGPHAARSVGASEATGQFIQFLDDDDILRETKFEKQLPLFSETVGVVYSGVEIYETGKVKRPDLDAQGEVIEKALQVRLPEPVCTCSLLIRAELVRRILPLKNRHGCDDDGLELELALRTDFAAVDEPLVLLRKETDYSVGGIETTIQGRKVLLDMYAHLYDLAPPRVRRKVLFDIYRLQAKSELTRNVWSARAILYYMLAAYYAPERRTKRIGVALASLFGRPGIEAAVNVLDRLTGPPSDPT